MEKLETVISPVAKSILERFNCNNTTLKDNEECRKVVNSEIKNSGDLTDYGKKVLEAGRKAGQIVVGKETAYEMVDHPNHYNLYDIEAIDMIERIWGAENAALWCEITAFKYRMRMGTKPGEDVTRDLNKEQWYLKKAKELRNKIS